MKCDRNGVEIIIFSKNIKKSPCDRGFAYKPAMSCTTLLSSPPIEAIFKQKKFNFNALSFRKTLIALLFMGVLESRKIVYFAFNRPAVFLFFLAH